MKTAIILATVFGLGLAGNVLAEDVIHGDLRATWSNYDGIGIESKDTQALSRFQSGEAATSEVPLFLLNADPVLGTTPFLFIGPADPRAQVSQTLAMVFLGLERANIVTDLGTLLVLGTRAFTIPMKAGGLLVALPIPNDPILVGFDFFLQSLQGSASAPGNAVFSLGLQIHTGF